MANVTLENLSKIYPDPSGREMKVVHGIDLEIHDREFMVLVGPSGCGKSTTLRMVAGLEEISGGRVWIDGRVVNDVLPKDRDIAMVFQNYALYPHMSVYDNMAFGLKLRKIPRAEIKERVRDASAMLGLDSYLDRKPKALSGGQRQRVAVGRAIVRKPKVFLFDEPLSNLDAKMRVSMRAEIARLHARLGATMIYVTHDQMEAMTMGDRICVMKDGRIMQVDAPLRLYNQPANMFVAGFIGSPPMNFFHGSIREQNGRRFFVENASGGDGVLIALDERLSAKASAHVGRKIVLGIRPEDVRDVAAAGPEVPSGAAINVRVEVSEPMGAETFLYLTTGATSFIAKVGADTDYTTGHSTKVALNLERAHLFDAETEHVIP
jgi:multiple sugar transport system ATP-binding protein